MTAVFKDQFYKRMTRLVAHLAKAPIVLLATRNDGDVEILASHGYEVMPWDTKWIASFVRTVDTMQIQYFRGAGSNSVRHYSEHNSTSGKVANKIELPIFIKTLAVFPISASMNGKQAFFILCDSELKTPFDTSHSFILMEATQIVAESLAHDRRIENLRENVAPQGFTEATPGNFLASEAPEPASQFLLETLIKRHGIKSRNGVSYLTARAWNSSLKNYQIRALAALKCKPPDAFVEAAADEIVDLVTRLAGVPTFTHVTPMPCGHSGHDRCFSVLLAEAAARKMNIECVETFASEPLPGSSHPRESARLKPFRWIAEPRGPTLLVDDVVSSGKHIELAVRQLREKIDRVVPVAWIGA